MLKKIFRKIIKNQGGTTIVEAMIVVVLLSLGLIPSLLVILLSGNLTSAITNNLIASYLAQEGVEVVRAIRDANWLNSQVFDNGLAAGTYVVEWNSTGLTPVGSNPILKIDNNGLYNYSVGNDTIFRRRLLIVKDPSSPGCNCELRIISEVTWPERGTTKKIEVESHIYDWR